MNIILFHPAEVELPLSRRDPRASHILDVLRRQPGDAFDAGLINGPRGRGTLTAINPDSLTLTFAWGEPPPPLAPVHLLIGLPRPQTARDILRDATSLGVAALHFIRSDKGEPSYASSGLWLREEWKHCVTHGAAQAFCTRLPEVSHGHSLGDVLARLPAGAWRAALDNYEAPEHLSRCGPAQATAAVLAVGAERGWSPRERDQLRDAGFAFAHLGPRVLRTETACVAAITLLKARLGWL